MSEDRTPTPRQAEQAFSRMLTGKCLAQALSVAAELGVADLLKDGAQDVGALAAQTSANADALYRLLRALAAEGVFTALPGRKFANNELSEVLRTDAPRSARDIVRWIGSDVSWRAWGSLAHSVRTGQPAFDHLYGVPFFDYITTSPATAEVFDAGMASSTAVNGLAVAEAYDYSTFGKLVDVGGGHGALLLSILDKHPHVLGILYDRPDIVAGARAVIEASRHRGRVEIVGGDFFSRVPAGADAYLLKHIIHDWDDDRAVRILQNCRDAMAPDGRVLIADMVIHPDAPSSFATMMDLEMLVMTTGGRERTQEDFAALLARAGLTLTRVVRTSSPLSIVEACR